jgi:transcriptional regulator with XRE-family HTH domain
MSKALAPEVRAQFSHRLKKLRVQNGYPRARYFARSLGIEENRYTRYERAEVEPSLTLLHKMCEILKVSPNELMGFADPAGSSTVFGEELSQYAEAGERSNRDVAQLAWKLASETVHSRAGVRARTKVLDDPLAAPRETGKLFQQLQADPFGTVALIVADDTLKHLDAKRKSEFAELISEFTGAVTKAAPRAKVAAS